MIVTDKEYSMDSKLAGKLDLMIKRMQGTDDNILLIDGDEGQGKTEMAMGACYYVSHNMGRTYNVKHIFFELDEVIKFASSTEQQVIHFDEGALGLQSTQWWNKNQQKFLTLCMVARKKKHFIVICIPKFYKLSQYITEERSIGLIHVYSRKNMQKGRFCYFTKRAKDKLIQQWKKRKVKTYKKYHSFHGTFPQASKKIFVDEEMLEYEKNKDQAIFNVGSPESTTSSAQDRFLTQRNLLIKYVVDDKGYSSRKGSEALKQLGVDLSSVQILKIIKEIDPIRDPLPLTAN